MHTAPEVGEINKLKSVRNIRANITPVRRVATVRRVAAAVRRQAVVRIAVQVRMTRRGRRLRRRSTTTSAGVRWAVVELARLLLPRMRRGIRNAL